MSSNHSTPRRGGQDEDWLEAIRQYDVNVDDEDDDDEDQEYEDAEDEDGEEDEEDEENEEDEEDEDEDDEEEDDDHDGGGGGIEFEVLIEELLGQGEGSRDQGDGGGEQAAAAPQRRVVRIGGGGRHWRPFLTQREFLALLRGQYLNPTLVGDEDGEGQRLAWNERSRNRRFPKVPSNEGRKLMDSGVFGTYDRRMPARKALARRLLDRELGLGGWTGQKVNQGLMAQAMIPSTKPEMVVHYDDPVCCGQFSDDGNFFYACVKDFKIRLYDTSSPYNWKHYKTVTYPFGQWTMTDADLSPDNKWLAFSSLQPHVGIAATDPNDTGDPYSLDLADGGRSGRSEFIFGGFAIFSVRFSGDGRHIVAGTGNNSIVVYDIERRKSLHHVLGHQDDVNAVCFADKQSPHILYSGSDDCTIKVWDTRSMGDGREAGAFVGHTEGLTYIDSKGDGRYILSNGKDQSMKLWDLRMAMSTSRFEELDPTAVTRNREYDYDYRWQPYEDYQWFQHPHDNSLVTFRGHEVRRTLIRCHFSPPNSTDSHYVYSGSHDGYIYVWNLDATIAAKIDVKSATRASSTRPRPERRHRLHHRYPHGWESMVRDVGWHPNAPMLVASSWCGPGYEVGTASLHSFNEGEADEGDPVMGISVNEKLEPYPDGGPWGL
ncbi:WD40-repeat-containing domain protein [Corynascus novoguineensis]|uniref:WD40-repeat-containing domain protein n=1 Tax=Corynascus novoguineensis TaxID=1126955 RepID=A0AAN7HMP4_9PEZI|nr:WD40-repeat-containing domain protein [Corynascus novoguineensis]